jgi:hypothetical protein
MQLQANLARRFYGLNEAEKSEYAYIAAVIKYESLTVVCRRPIQCPIRP